MNRSNHPFPLFVLLIVSTLVQAPVKTDCQRQEELDSLERAVNSMQDENERITLLMKLSEGYLVTSPDKSLEYSDQLLILSARRSSMAGVIDALLLKSRAHRILYNYDSAIYFNDRAIFLADSMRDDKRLASLFSHKGHTLFRARGAADGIEYYAKSYKLYKMLNDSLGMADALNGLGVMFQKLAVFDSSVYYLLEMVSMSEKLDSEESLGKGYVNLGNSYYCLNELEKASTYLEKSISINEKYNKTTYLAVANNILGNIADERDDLEEALKKYEKCLELYQSINNRSGIADAMVNIGNIFEKRHEMAKAMEFYLEANAIFEDIADWEGYLISYKNIGLIHERRGEYDVALAIYDSCLTIAGGMKDLYILREIYFNIYKTYEIMGNYRKAFNFLEIHDIYKDSIYNLEKTKTIADLELKYQKEKDQAKILKLVNENLEKDLVVEKRTSQRNIYLFTGIGIITLILFLLIFYRQKAIKNRILAENKIRKLEEEKRMLLARALVEGQEEERKRIASELHDGLGVLLSAVRMQFTSIKDKSPGNRPMIERASKLLEQASGDVRRISHNMMPGLLTKFGLFEALGDLFDQIREAEELEVSAEIPEQEERLPENKEIMLYRIIQELVNNTLRHAGAEHIKLVVRVVDKSLEIDYADDGKGFELKEKLEAKSLGLQSILSRIDFLSGKIEIQSKTGEGTSFHIRVPV